MALDPHNIDPAEWITLKEAIEYFPDKPTLKTIRRWIHEGKRGYRLECLRWDRLLLTTPAAIRRFCAAVATCSGQPAGDGVKYRERQKATAERRLATAPRKRRKAVPK